MITLISPTDFTPYVGIDAAKNTLCMAGICAPENAHLFFDALNDSLVSQVEGSAKIDAIYFDMEYFNSASTRIIMDLIRGVNPKNVFTERPAIVWMYDATDEEMQDAGKLLEELTERTFTHVPKIDTTSNFALLSDSTRNVLARTFSKN